MAKKPARKAALLHAGQVKMALAFAGQPDLLARFRDACSRRKSRSLWPSKMGIMEPLVLRAPGALPRTPGYLGQMKASALEHPVGAGGEQAAGVVGCHRAHRPGRRGCSSSTARPCCMTRMRSHMWSITARSWLTIRKVRPRSARRRDQQVQDFGLHRGVERARSVRPAAGSRVPASARGRWRRAGAGRRTAGAGSGSGRGGQAHIGQRLHHARDRCRGRPWMASGSDRVRSMVWRGCRLA